MSRLHTQTSKGARPDGPPRLLNIQSVTFDNKVSDDGGSGADGDLITWKPKLPLGWYYLGPAANDGTADGVDGLIVQPIGDVQVLVPVTDWEQVWNDRGSGKGTDYALWRGLPAPANRVDYVFLGGYFTRSWDKPSSDEARGMMAIHKDALITVTAGKEIWNDRGTGARKDGSVWDVSTGGNLEAILTGAFIAAEGHGDPPKATYAIDRQRVDHRDT